MDRLFRTNPSKLGQLTMKEQPDLTIGLGAVLFCLRVSRKLKREEFGPKYLGCRGARVSKLERGEVKRLKNQELERIKQQVTEEESAIIELVNKRGGVAFILISEVQSNP